MRFKVEPKTINMDWHQKFVWWQRTQDGYLVVCGKVWSKYIMNGPSGHWIYRVDRK